ncbi:cytochrome C oxidase subunit IV family protein [Colwellia sp. 12G3]|uniref:cytochrome C oxidase subunit IV family protein n=1 Tax=Colwellia sp. 12G3 TaxID=2058299 RepID=UPI000C33992F|nr:hypothetical protein CXF71_11145 [Colwellia sp. 12G3]
MYRSKTSFKHDLILWLVLVLFTLLSWILGHDFTAIDTKILSIIILIIGFIKVRIVLMNFMEIKTAPRYLRWFMDGWCLGVCGLLLFILYR